MRSKLQLMFIFICLGCRSCVNGQGIGDRNRPAGSDGSLRDHGKGLPAGRNAGRER